MGGGGKGSGKMTISSKNLPALQGSEKQIAWAEDIRKNYIEHINALLASDGDEDISVEFDKLSYSNLARTRETAFDTYLRKVKGMKGREADDYLENLTSEAVKAEEKAKEKAKAAGIKKQQRKEIGEKAYNNFYKKHLKEAVDYALGKCVYADGWINDREVLYYKK